MVYPNLKFPIHSNRPFFYTNFVSTVDGKVQVLKNSKDYWPIGSKTDNEVLQELRSYADVLIHGKNLAQEFGEITLNNLKNPNFQKQRIEKGKNPELPYYIVTNHPNEISLKDPLCHIEEGDLGKLSKNLFKRGSSYILVEGGPTLLASFLKEDLIDDIFLTIAPKLFGSEAGSTLTLVEGYLFPKNSIKNLSLLSMKKLKSEIYLHYKVMR